MYQSGIYFHFDSFPAVVFCYSNGRSTSEQNTLHHKKGFTDAEFSEISQTSSDMDVGQILSIGAQGMRLPSGTYIEMLPLLHMSLVLMVSFISNLFYRINANNVLG